MPDGIVTTVNIDQDYVIGKGSGYHDPEGRVLKIGDGFTPFKDLPNLYQYALPPDDGVIYGLLNQAYAPIVFADPVLVTGVHTEPLEFI